MAGHVTKGFEEAARILTAAGLQKSRPISVGTYTVAQGERVQVVDSTGNARCYDGPRWLLLWRSEVQPLCKLTAERTQALRVRHHDGTVEQLPGPVQLWFEPLRHRSVELVEPVALAEGETLVVYASEASGGEVVRRIVPGPALHLPETTEWTHRFAWTGQDPKDPHDNAKKIAGRLVFEKLRTTPQQLYFDVVDARTADDALVTCKFMVFYDLVDIELMLRVTGDPIAELINAMAADVIEFGASRRFEGFKEQSPALNELKTYGHLARRATGIGYRVTKVVFRGYVASANLQSMHDKAIEQRTQLVLARETAEKQEELADFELQRKSQRAAVERTEEQATQQHKMKLQDAEAQAELIRAELAHASMLKQQDAAAEAELARAASAHSNALQQRERDNAQQVAHMRNLAEVGVEPTRYAVADVQGRPTQLYVIEGAAATQLHVHPKSDQ